MASTFGAGALPRDGCGNGAGPPVTLRGTRLASSQEHSWLLCLSTADGRVVVRIDSSDADPVTVARSLH